MGSIAKEDTIRALVFGCQKRQEELQTKLDVSFRRTLPENKEKEVPHPTLDNVLDEIIEELRELRVSQNKTIEFIVAMINPKL